ncbi:MAG: galactokinase family protein [Gemmatimonadales bacterium]
MSFWVPGRIEVLGKHTDYGGGRSLLCAVERGVCMVARANASSPHAPSSPRERGPMFSASLKMDSRFRGNDEGSGPDDEMHPDDDLARVAHIRVTDANSGETCEFELSPDVRSTPGKWSNYPITVARRIAMNFSGPMLGADIIFSSDLPHAAGVSSSSALVVAIFLALSAVNDLPQRPEYRENILSPEDLGGYLGCVENGLDFKSLRGSAGVGTFGGSEDQTAILCARPDTLVQYSFCPVRFERAIQLPSGFRFVIASSGVMAEKTGAALERYNRVSRRLSVGLEAWRAATGSAHLSMGEAIASSRDAHDRIREVLGATSDEDYSAYSLLDRFDQFHVEANEIIPAAGDALASGDLNAFGELVERSQGGAERALENQIPETIALVQQARQLGAVAASAFGAGFGGSVWAFVEASSAEAFRARWKDSYSAAFPSAAPHAEFFTTRAGPAALRL